MDITLTADKGKVMEAVAEATAYTGAKMGDEAEAAANYRRIATVDEDNAHLERFWRECRSELCQELIGIVKEEGEDAGGRYTLTLDVSGAFDAALLESMQLSLRSFFSHGIAGKWYAYTNKGEAGAYADKAALLLEDIHRKALYKRRPTRPTYN